MLAMRLHHLTVANLVLIPDKSKVQKLPNESKGCMGFSRAA